MSALLVALAVLLLLPRRDGRLRRVVVPPAGAAPLGARVPREHGRDGSSKRDGLPRRNGQPGRCGPAGRDRSSGPDAPTGPDRPSGSARRPASPHAPALACGASGLALALLLGGAVGPVLGLLLLLLGPPALRRLEPAAVRREEEELAAGLPLALDLLAACLAGGATLRAAVEAVAGASAGPVGERLHQVAGALLVGTPPEGAWSALAVTAGRPSAGDRTPSSTPGPAAEAARALGRACAGGAPAAALVARLAAEARAQARAEAEQRARRAGVLAVLPLGLCFLPAFVLLGVVPVVVGLAGPLLAAL